MTKTNETPERAASIPDGRGAIPVQGYEAQVKKFKTNLRFYEQLDQQIADDKVLFRTLAAQAAKGALGSVRRVEFLAEDGSMVPVVFPDPAKAGNRTVVKPELVNTLLTLGVDINELDVTETETTLTLSGPFVQWFRENVLAPNYTSHGLAIPEGVEEKSTTRISEAGIHKLRELVQTAPDAKLREAAALLLEEGIKAATVTAK